MLRIGHEDRVADNTQHLLMEAPARSLQQTIQTQTEPYAQALNNFVDGLDIIRSRLQT